MPPAYTATWNPACDSRALCHPEQSQSSRKLYSHNPKVKCCVRCCLKSNNLNLHLLLPWGTRCHIFPSDLTVHIQSNIRNIIKSPIYSPGWVSSSTGACNDLQTTGHTECGKATNRPVLANVFPEDREFETPVSSPSLCWQLSSSSAASKRCLER